MQVNRYPVSLYIFRRDLRLHDNTALNQALADSDTVIPCFIFDPRQIQPHPYQSLPALQFMLESLADLQVQLQPCNVELGLLQGLPVEIIRILAEQKTIQAVYINRDYTPFSRTRDDEIAKLCQQLGIDFHVCPDYILVEPEQGCRDNGTPYKVFTPFYQHLRQFQIPLPENRPTGRFCPVSDKLKQEFGVTLENIQLQIGEDVHIAKGGRSQALAILGQLASLRDYQTKRDFPALDKTSHLSAHLKFGTCSVREAWHAIANALGLEHPLLRQLYWRDFFTHVAYHYPKVFGQPFLRQYNNLAWDNNQEKFTRWCEGTTGFPIVDAGMKELNTTGFMHNRVRMIVASFLTKDLHIDWRWGERYFARHLVDYDPAVNNGNWQWAASTGCDAQPYFRIFNPWLQQQKFDPDCTYIKQWLPELANLPAKIIHNWQSQHQNATTYTYPAPMLDHAQVSKVAKLRYQALTDG